MTGLLTDEEIALFSPLAEALNEEQGPPEDKDKEEIISNIDMIKELSDTPFNPYIFNTGFETVDKACEGIIPGELVILSGPTKNGKSLFMKSIINNMNKQGKHPLVFSWEEMPRQFFKSFDNNSQDLLFYLPRVAKAYDVDWVIEKSLQAKAKTGVNVVFLDHGFYLFELSDKGNASLGIGNFVRKLKRFAVTEEMIVVLIWHIKKGEIKSIEDMDYSLLAHSGFLGYESDVVLFMFRKVTSDGLTSTSEAFVKVCFTRRSGCYNAVVPLVKDGNYFREISVDD
jgi:predicted ATP-dependent serine protease